MAPFQMRLRITIGTGNADVGIMVPAQSTDRVSELIARLVRECGLGGEPSGWNLLFTDRILPPSRTLREVVPAALDPIPLTLRPVAGSSFAIPTSATSRGAIASPSTGSVGIEVETVPTRRELDAVLTPTERTRPGPGQTTPSRASIRYHSQMNPNRVYPLTVTLTRDDVARLLQQHGDRGSGTTKLSLRSPLEIEPILPGCGVYPQRVTARIDGTEEVFRFHVVPNVVGEVAGARVVVRQDNVTLAELDLEARVAQRTWTWLAGLATVGLPVVSVAVNQSGAELHSGDEVRPELAALRFLFLDLQPIILAGVLALITLLLWFLSQPRARDVPWDVTARPAG